MVSGSMLYDEPGAADGGIMSRVVMVVVDADGGKVSCRAYRVTRSRAGGYVMVDSRLVMMSVFAAGFTSMETSFGPISTVWQVRDARFQTMATSLEMRDVPGGPRMM